MRPIVFLDTNVILRHLLQDDVKQSRKATDFLKTVEEGNVAVVTSDTVIFESVFLLERHYHRDKKDIRDALLSILDMPGIVLQRKKNFKRVFELYIEHNIDFADAYHVALMERMALKQIASFDQDYDKVPGVTRFPL